jgi:hypothetical protein
MKPNRTMLPPDEGYLQAALVRLGRAISVACFAGSSMYCDENLPSERPLLTLTAWCLPGSIIWPLASGPIGAGGPRGGRPHIPLELRRLIRDISLANPLWGAPRIHGELLKLGIEIGQTTVAKYMAKERRPPSQGWRALLCELLQPEPNPPVLEQDAPTRRPVHTLSIEARPVLGGLHHHHVRI